MERNNTTQDKNKYQTKKQVTKESMTLVVSGRAKYTQAQGSLDSSLFQEYDCVEGAKFGINLTTLLECLQIFGPGSLAQTSVSMAYQEVSFCVVSAREFILVFVGLGLRIGIRTPLCFVD